MLTIRITNRFFFNFWNTPVLTLESKPPFSATFIHAHLVQLTWAARLGICLKENHPKWLRIRKTGTINSSILSHLVDSGHRIDPKKSFESVQGLPNRWESVRFCTVSTAEAIDIHLMYPTLCVQKLQWDEKLPLITC